MKANELIKKYRTKLGWTQEEVAKQLYIAKNTYSQYETGKRNIETEMFFNIMKLFGLECFFQQPEEENPNEVVADIYMRLQSQLQERPFHSHTLIHIAYRIEEILIEEDIDERWKDYFEVFVSEDNEDISVAMEHKDISFDSFGRVTGQGTCFIDRIPPWEQEKVDNLSYELAEKFTKIGFLAFHIPEDDALFSSYRDALAKEWKQIREKNFNHPSLVEKMPFIFLQSFATIYKKTKTLEQVPTDLFTLLEAEEPMIQDLQFTVENTKIDKEDKEFSIPFHIQNIGDYQVSLVKEESEHHWEIADVWHDFSKKNYICPYCKLTDSEFSSMSRCFPFIKKREEVFHALKKDPIVTDTLHREGISRITL